MALEPAMPSASSTRIEYTCPMHPEIIRSEPGACPICGMALEPRTVSASEEENPELSSMTRRFWISVSLDADVPEGEIRRLADASYDNVCAGLTKKQKAELAALTA